MLYPNSQIRGLVYRTTDGGNNWLYQVPDTSIHLGTYSYCDFINHRIGWAYTISSYSGIHTTTGGDTTFYTGITKQNENVPEDFELKQNYPNPFNPRTVIPFNLKKRAYVKLSAYDIAGREIQLLVHGDYNAGEYQVDFMGKSSSSGVYFYKIEITSDNSNERFTDTKRMILLK